jgi:hypothetical protein
MYHLGVYLVKRHLQDQHAIYLGQHICIDMDRTGISRFHLHSFAKSLRDIFMEMSLFVGNKMTLKNASPRLCHPRIPSFVFVNTCFGPFGDHSPDHSGKCSGRYCARACKELTAPLCTLLWQDCIKDSDCCSSFCHDGHCRAALKAFKHKLSNNNHETPGGAGGGRGG